MSKSWIHLRFIILICIKFISTNVRSARTLRVNIINLSACAKEMSFDIILQTDYIVDSISVHMDIWVFSPALRYNTHLVKQNWRSGQDLDDKCVIKCVLPLFGVIAIVNSARVNNSSPFEEQTVKCVKGKSTCIVQKCVKTLITRYKRKLNERKTVSRDSEFNDKSRITRTSSSQYK